MSDGSRQPRCYLDANIFIIAFEGPPGNANPLKTLLDRFRHVPYAAVTSEMTVAELLAPAGSLDLKEKKQIYLDLLFSGEFIDVRPISRDILVATADLRLTFPHKLADAIHVSTAVAAGCSFLMSSDKGMRRLPPSLTWLEPDTAGIATVLDVLRA